MGHAVSIRYLIMRLAFVLRYRGNLFLLTYSSAAGLDTCFFDRLWLSMEYHVRVSIIAPGRGQST